MKSQHKKRFPTAIGALICLAFLSPVLAQSPAGKRIVLQNVDPQTGNISAGQVTSIPLDPAQALTITAEGDVKAHCLGDAGKCPAIGAGAGSGGQFPTLQFTAPVAGTVIPEANQTATMTWTAPGAVECHGLTSSPTVASWNGKKFTNSQWEFVVGSLPRSSTETTYTFTLGCYSKDTSGVPVENAGFVKRSYQVKLAAAEGGGSPDPATSCTAYRDTVQPGATLPPKSQKGFLTQPGAILSQRTLDHATAFGGASFYQVLTQTAGGMGFLPGEQAQSGEYISIPLVVPEGGNFLNKGYKLSWSDPQIDGYYPGLIDINISPCPGDFRQPTSGSDADMWLRPTCRKINANNTALSASTGGPSGGTGNHCKLVPGTTMYLNITLHNTSQLGAPGNPVPDYRCAPGYNCAARIYVSHMPTTHN